MRTKFTWAALLIAVAFVCCVSTAEGKVVKAKTQHFYVTLDGDGSGKTFARVGPFLISAKCQLDRFNGVKIPNADRIRVYVKSLIGPRFATDGQTHAAGERVELLEVTTGTGSPHWQNLSELPFQAASDGHFVDIYSSAAGFNIFGHNCIFQGTLDYIEGASDP